MPVEDWFGTPIYYEEVALPDETRALALKATAAAIPADWDQERQRYMTATPTTLHLDERMAPLFRAIGPAIRRFVYDVIGCDPERTRLFVGRCRPVIQSAGGAGTFHHHGGATISGVFFLTAPEGSGGIEFLKPWRTAIDALPTCRETPYAFATVKYGAMQDRLVLFSSDLFHRALRSEAAEGELRIVLAFDLFAATDIRVDHSGLPHLEHLKPLE